MYPHQYPIASSTLSPVVVLPPFEQALCRPSEYFLPNMSKIVPQRYYNCFFKVSETEIKTRIEPTRKMIDKIRKYISDKDQSVV